MANPTESSQWALLPEDLLQKITHRLPKPCDYVRFGAVCKGWHSFAHKSYKQKHLLHAHQNFPLLLIPTEDQERRGLYNITQGMVYDQFQLHLPNKRCCGSSYGWLFFVDKVNESTFDLILINPFLGDSKTFKLPPITFCDEDEVVNMMDQCGVLKAILSKDPYVSPHDYEVVALYGHFARLAHYKSGDKFWSYAEKTNMAMLTDVIFYKDLILAVDRYNWIINFTLEPEGRIQSTNCSPWYLEWNTLRKQLPRIVRNYAGNAYLVEDLKGDLLLARRNFRSKDVLEAKEAAERWVAERAREIEEGGTALIDEYFKFEESYESEEESEEEDEPYLTVDFKVYRLSFSSTGKRLRKVTMKTLDGKTLFDGETSLDGEILFLGDNNSISVPASKYPQLRPNSIYYTDDDTVVYQRNLKFGSCDTGIFDVEKKFFYKHYVPCFSTKGMPPPIFVVPQ